MMIPVESAVALLAGCLVISHFLVAALTYTSIRAVMLQAQLAAINAQVAAEKAERSARHAEDAADSAHGVCSEAGELVDEANDLVQSVSEDPDDDEDGEEWRRSLDD